MFSVRGWLFFWGVLWGPLMCSGFTAEIRSVEELCSLGKKTAELFPDGVVFSDIWGVYVNGGHTLYSVGVWGYGSVGGYSVISVTASVVWSDPPSVTILETKDITAAIIKNNVDAKYVDIPSVPWNSYPTFSAPVYSLLYGTTTPKRPCISNSAYPETSYTLTSQEIDAGTCRPSLSVVESSCSAGINPVSLSDACFKNGRASSLFFLTNYTVSDTTCTSISVNELPTTFNASMMKTLAASEFAADGIGIPVLSPFSDGASVRSAYAPTFMTTTDFSDTWGFAAIVILEAPVSIPQFYLCFRRLGQTILSGGLLPNRFYCTPNAGNAKKYLSTVDQVGPCVSETYQTLAQSPCIDGYRLISRGVFSNNTQLRDEECVPQQTWRETCQKTVNRRPVANQHAGFFNKRGGVNGFTAAAHLAVSFSGNVEPPFVPVPVEKRIEQINSKIFGLSFLGLLAGYTLCWIASIFLVVL